MAISLLLALCLLFLATTSGRPIKQAHFDNITNITSSNDVRGLIRLIEKFPALQLPYLSSDPCYPEKLTWIECSNDVVPRVTALYLGSRNLYGYLPDFRSMDALQTIDMHGNSLLGPIPDFLGTFPELTFLDLSNNDFTGVLPDSLVNNKKIKLNLTGNLLQLSLSSSSTLHFHLQIPAAKFIFPRLQLLFPLPPSPQFLFPPLAPDPPSPQFQFPPLAPNPPSPQFQFPHLAPDPPSPLFQFPPLAPNPPSPQFLFPPLAPNPPSPRFEFPPLAPNPPSPHSQFSPTKQTESRSSSGSGGGGGGSFDLPDIGKIKKSKLPRLLKFTVPPSFVAAVAATVGGICCCKRRRNQRNADSNAANRVV